MHTFSFVNSPPHPACARHTHANMYLVVSSKVTSMLPHLRDESEIKGVFSRMDHNGDGVVDLTDFLMWEERMQEGRANTDFYALQEVCTAGSRVLEINEMGGRKETTYNVDMFLRVGEVIGLAVPSDVCRSELTFPRRKGVLQYFQCRAIEAEPGLFLLFRGTKAACKAAPLMEALSYQFTF